MADDLQIPKDLTKVVQLNDKPLYDFLVKLTNRIKQLEKRITELENGS